MGRRFHRRRYVGRRKSARVRSGLTVFLVLLFTALVVFLTVKAGLVLRDSADAVRQESEFLSTAETDEAVTLAPPVDATVSDLKVQGSFVSVSDPQSISIPEGGTISTVFKSASGVNFYRSPAVEAVSGPQSEDLPTADELMTALTRSGSRTSVIFYRENTEGMDSIAAQAVLEVAVSQMCEIAKAGADEILLVGFETNSENLGFLASASAKIKAANPDTLVGITLPMNSVIGGDRETVNTICRTMSEHFDIIALDLTDLRDSEDQSGAEQLRKTIDDLPICFARYNLRCIFRDGDEANSSLTRVLEDEYLANYQFTSKSGLKTELP